MSNQVQPTLSAPPPAPGDSISSSSTWVDPKKVSQALQAATAATSAPTAAPVSLASIAVTLIDEPAAPPAKPSAPSVISDLSSTLLPSSANYQAVRAPTATASSSDAMSVPSAPPAAPDIPLAISKLPSTVQAPSAAVAAASSSDATSAPSAPPAAPGAPPTISSSSSCLLPPQVRKSKQALYDELEQRTWFALQGVQYLNQREAAHPFADIQCAKNTAIKVGENDYLHANQMGLTERQFIASCAPDIRALYYPPFNVVPLFWKAALARNGVIFDLTTDKDSEPRNGVTPYYPTELLETKTYGRMEVTLLLKDGEKHVYLVKDLDTGEEEPIIRYHCKQWPDRLDVALPLLERLIKQIEGVSPDQPVWLHCRAGVGRTGTLIAACILKEIITRKEINRDNLETKLLDIIVELRKQRDQLVVQTEDQLDLLRRFGESLLNTHPAQ